MTEGQHASEPGPPGGLQPLQGVLDDQHLIRTGHAPLLDQAAAGRLIGLGIGFLAGHIVAANPETEDLGQGSQQVLVQGLHRPTATGGDDGLGQAKGMGLAQNNVDAGPQLELTCGHQQPVVILFGALKRLGAGGVRVATLELPQLGRDALATAADAQPTPVMLGIPVNRQPRFGKGPVEGQAMAVPLGLGQGSIHVPEQRPQRHGLHSAVASTVAWAGLDRMPTARTMGRPRPSLLLPSIDRQRWQLPQPLPQRNGAEAAALAQQAQLCPELVSVLLRRGHGDGAAIAELLQPAAPPPAGEHFADLSKAVQRLVAACRAGEALAICGDYDADGMTSTALLMGVLQRLGAQPSAAIPSRMEDGYGLNAAMVERLAASGIGLLITVDNGVSARDALERAQALGVEVILTDHHTLPDQLPPHLALLHPAVTPPDSPYRGLAGVGLAYVLAAALAEALGDRQGLAIALHLFCIGTIADMAPLQGVNRRWLMDGLPQLNQTPLPGLTALQQLAGLDGQPVTAETVGFQLAPRINAVGRLGDPSLVVELLTTADSARALELARQCEALNRQRRELCEAIEAEALALLDADGEQRSPFLLLAQNHWHHGVIGIVAARLVERFGRPVALLAGEGNGRLRASVRSPRGFAVDAALQACAPWLERFGGHPAAGGFTVRAEQVAPLHEALNTLAAHWLSQQGEGIPVEPEALLALARIDRPFWQQLSQLAPFGSGHSAPVFWSRRCQVLEQNCLRGGHLQLLLGQGEARLRAMGWRWQGRGTVPELVDVAYRVVLDRWQQQERLQLELVGLRPAADPDGQVLLQAHNRSYWCHRDGDELVLRNAAGRELRQPITAEGSASSQHTAHHPYVQGLLEEAALALGLAG